MENMLLLLLLSPPLPTQMQRSQSLSRSLGTTVLEAYINFPFQLCLTRIRHMLLFFKKAMRFHIAALDGCWGSGHLGHVTKFRQGRRITLRGVGQQQL